MRKEICGEKLLTIPFIIYKEPSAQAEFTTPVRRGHMQHRVASVMPAAVGFGVDHETFLEKGQFILI